MRAILLIIIVVTAGCDRGASTADLDRPSTWTLVEDQRIGSVDDEAKGFTRIDELLVARDRTIYAVSNWEGRFRVIDATGAFLPSFGGLGGGPGEFKRIDRVGFLGDTVWAADEQADRLTKFDRSGSVIQTYAEGYKPAFPGALLADGTSLRTRRLRAAGEDTALVLVLVAGHPGRVAAMGGPDSAGMRGLPSVGVATSAPLVGDTIRVLSRRNWSATVPILFPYNRNPVSVIFFQPLTDAPFWRASIDGRFIVIVDRPAAHETKAAQFTVVKLTPGLDTVFSERYAYTPVPAPGALIDSIIANSEEGKLGMKRDVVFAPAFRPPVTDALIANDGSVWLKREFSYGADARWSVIDRDGRLVGEVSIPQHHTVRAADDRYVWATLLDENDVAFVVRYRIVKGASDS